MESSKKGMDDPYEVLEIKRDANRAEIRRKFQELARKYHPDKLDRNATQLERNAAADRFHKLSHAYHLLTDDATRHQLDLETRASEMAETLIINETIDISDFTQEQNGSTSLHYQCRCGGQYSIDNEPGNAREQCIIGCDTCSLHIAVTF